MHDPMTVAHEIHWPRMPWQERNKYRTAILTIWHVDPERDGSDDSCGWFMRARHCDQNKLKKIASDFDFHMTRFDKFSWFKPDGSPNLSTIAIVVSMFQIAANVHFGHWSRRSRRFLRDNALQIIQFAENATDSLVDDIEERYGCNGKTQAERAKQYASVIYSWLCRSERPWWKAPRWHVHHWRFQFHPWQQLKRRWWDKCCICGKRGFKPGVSAMGDWGGNRVWHSTCGRDLSPPCSPEPTP